MLMLEFVICTINIKLITLAIRLFYRLDRKHWAHVDAPFLKATKKRARVYRVSFSSTKKKKEEKYVIAIQAYKM